MSGSLHARVCKTNGLHEKGCFRRMLSGNFLPTTFTEQEKISLLVIAPRSEDYAALREIFHHKHWRLRHARTLAEAQPLLLQDRQPSVVLCDRELPDGDWKQAHRYVSQAPGKPLLVVMEHHADQRLWAEVLNLGGYDVLLKPFEKSEVLRVVSMAWRQARRHVAQPATAMPALAFG